MKRVYGNKNFAIPLTIGKSMVYVRTNIEECVTEEDLAMGAYKWDEEVYKKDEYIKMMDEKNAVMSEELTSVQIALCESYEHNLILEEELTNTQLALCEIYEMMEV